MFAALEAGKCPFFQYCGTIRTLLRDVILFIIDSLLHSHAELRISCSPQWTAVKVCLYGYGSSTPGKV